MSMTGDEIISGDITHKVRMLLAELEGKYGRIEVEAGVITWLLKAEGSCP